MAALSLWAGIWASVLPCIPLGLLAAWVARNTGRNGQVVQTHNAAFQRTLAGDFVSAETMLREIEPLAKSRYLERALWSQRALIALYQGDLAGVEAAAGRALEKPARLATRLVEEQHIAAAHGMRALARALQGRAEAAQEDVAAAETYPERNATVLGRILLTRLVVEARAGDRAGLRRLVAESQRGRFVEELAPRERALYRSYRRLAFEPGPGAYRELANPDAEPEAAFMQGAVRVAHAPVASVAADPNEVSRVLQERQKSASKRTFRGTYVAVALWVGVFVLILTVITALSGGGTAGTAPVAVDDGTASTSVLTWLLFLLPVGLAIWRVRRNLRRQRQLGLAQHLDAIGDEAAARAILLPMRKGHAAALSAQADLLLGGLEYAAGRFEAAAELGASGLARIPGGQIRALHSDVLVPGLSELRAVSLAALGRIEPARAELVVLLRECPSYAFRARAEYRVALLCAVTAGDFAAARVIARSRPEASLALREEILGDLVSMEEAASAAERQRVADELAESPALSHWIEALAPGLAARVSAGRPALVAELLDEEEPGAARPIARA